MFTSLAKFKDLSAGSHGCCQTQAQLQKCKHNIEYKCGLVLMSHTELLLLNVCVPVLILIVYQVDALH